MAACGDDRTDPPYGSARAPPRGRASGPRSQLGHMMKPAVPQLHGGRPQAAVSGSGSGAEIKVAGIMSHSTVNSREVLAF